MRIPLYLKLMASYLLVVGLVVVPTTIYIRTAQLTEVRTSFFFNQVVAISLSAAVLLSLVAAIVVSRPLRRVTQVARAFAAGDFGAPLDGMPKDEVGDVALAIADLASQLRGKLLAGGVDRATLQALLDELPVAVVIYERAGEPAFIGAGARTLLDLDPENEQARVQQILEDAVQAPLVAQVLANGEARDARLALGWLAGKPFAARWIAVFGPDGSRRPALVLTDRSLEQRLEGARELLEEMIELLRRAAKATPNAQIGAALISAALQAEQQVQQSAVRAEHVAPANLGSLCRSAMQDLAPVFQQAGVELELKLDEAASPVANVAGRCEHALRSWLAAAVADAAGPRKLQLSDDVIDGCIRLSLPAAAEAVELDRVAQSLRAFGGDAGQSVSGENHETWLILPRA